MTQPRVRLPRGFFNRRRERFYTSTWIALPDSYRLNPDLKIVTAKKTKINAPAEICDRLCHVNERTNSAGTDPINAAGMMVSSTNLVEALNSALGYSEKVSRALNAI